MRMARLNPQSNLCRSPRSVPSKSNRLSRCVDPGSERIRVSNIKWRYLGESGALSTGISQKYWTPWRKFSLLFQRHSSFLPLD
jgi:hypothetical protein